MITPYQEDSTLLGVVHAKIQVYYVVSKNLVPNIPHLKNPVARLVDIPIFFSPTIPKKAEKGTTNRIKRSGGAERERDSGAERNLPCAYWWSSEVVMYLCIY
ncbi:unnamed protein product [Periconia digitata]|uniref:Uncharacterized protein n=1 Tax=Periconia digitata TaxID=1303443 RepID=A0A9W4URY2_9PLEO|nr:unnamed protein product [Periconia digitata]